MNNCTNNSELVCYDRFIFSGIAFIGLIILPFFCAIKYCVLEKKIQEQIVLVPGYVHRDPPNIELPPEYKENQEENERIV